MIPSFGLAAALGLYSLAWRAARPVLRRHKRLADAFDQRLVPPDWAPPAKGASSPIDVWIQAASGGEAFLARRLLAELALSASPLRVLCTSCTRQGLDILETARQWAVKHAPALDVTVRLFPLDEPALMRRALRLASPRLLLLLETELWPGLLAACAEAKTPVALINGRMTEKSLRGYRLLRPLWRYAAPSRVLAVSDADAARFADIFGPDRVGIMPNMKFDSVEATPQANAGATGQNSSFSAILPSNLPVLLLASVRREEEELLLPAITELREKAPHSTLVIAPRHMERVRAWQAHLPGALLRSAKQAAAPGDIVIWDTFGELRDLYARADAVFVGGSLAPLGGQNFLEPAVLGHIPCLGPHLKNFAWVGEDFFDEGLAVRVPDAAGMAREMVARLANPMERGAVAAKVAAYLAPRRGGGRMAAAVVRGMLARSV